MLGMARERSLEGQLRSGTDEKRVEAALALAKHDSPAAVSALTDALSDHAMQVRAAAGLALASLRDPASIPALAEIVAGWDGPELARCCRAALRTLTAFRGQEAAVALARALTALPPERPLGHREHSALLAVTYAEPAGRLLRSSSGGSSLRSHMRRDPVAERAASLLTLFPA